MTRITGSRTRWLIAAGAIVLAAAAACRSAPDQAPGAAAPATAPATTPTSDPAPANTPANTPAAVPATVPANRPPVEPRHIPTAPPRPTPPRCHTADLALEVGQADSATSHTGLNLALVNRSTHRCRVYGYGGIQLLDAAGAALPTHQDRGQPRPTLLTLRPGDRAYSSLYWISNTDAMPCYTASAVQVIPPDETQPIRAPFTYTVCGNGVIAQGAYKPTPT